MVLYCGVVGLACTFLPPEHQQGGFEWNDDVARPRLFTFIQNRCRPTIQLSFSPCFVSFVATVTSSPLKGRNSFRKQCLLFLGKRETRRSLREIKFWKISYKFHVKEISVDLLIICLLTP